MMLPCKIRQHGQDIVHTEVNADGIARLLVEEQHDGLAAAAGFPGTCLAYELAIDQLIERDSIRSLCSARLSRRWRPAKTGAVRDNRLEDDRFIEFLH